ncbi:hypothetical protein RintRC_4616 [Richelia intracellularis]|nr:hypothetical protein RintRC_4616 [Richelia intracellularis]
MGKLSKRRLGYGGFLYILNALSFDLNDIAIWKQAFVSLRGVR